MNLAQTVQKRPALFLLKVYAEEATGCAENSTVGGKMLYNMDIKCYIMHNRMCGLLFAYGKRGRWRTAATFLHGGKGNTAPGVLTVQRAPAGGGVSRCAVRKIS